MAATDTGDLSNCQGKTHFIIPKGLKGLLEEMSREVLRNQPENIYEFLANYLEGKCKKQDFSSTGNNPDIGVGTGGNGDLPTGSETMIGTTDPSLLPQTRSKPPSPYGISPGGDPIPGPNVNAPYGYGPDGKALEKLDPTAPFGYGPDGKPLPGAACVAPYGFGPDGDPLEAEDPKAPFGYHLSDGLPIATNDPTAPFGYGPDGEPLQGRDPNAPFGYDESGRPNTVPELVSFCGDEDERFPGEYNGDGNAANGPLGEGQSNAANNPNDPGAPNEAANNPNNVGAPNGAGNNPNYAGALNGAGSGNNPNNAGAPNEAANNPNNVGAPNGAGNNPNHAGALNGAGNNPNNAGTPNGTGNYGNHPLGGGPTSAGNQGNESLGEGSGGAGNNPNNPGGLDDARNSGNSPLARRLSQPQDSANTSSPAETVQAQKMAELSRLNKMKDEICGEDPDSLECTDAQIQSESAAAAVAAVTQGLQTGPGCGEEGGIMYFNSGGANVLVSLDPRYIGPSQPTCSPTSNNPGVEAGGGQRNSDDCGGGAMRAAMQNMLTRVMSIMSNIMSQNNKCSAGSSEGIQNSSVPGMGKSVSPPDSPARKPVEEASAGMPRTNTATPAQDGVLPQDSQARTQTPEPPLNSIEDPLLDIQENTGTTGETAAFVDGVGPEGAGDMCGLDTADANADCTPAANPALEEDMQAGTVGEPDQQGNNGLQIPEITVIAPSGPDVRMVRQEAPPPPPEAQVPASRATLDGVPPQQVESQAAAAQSPNRGASKTVSIRLDEMSPQNEEVSAALPAEPVPSKAASVRSPPKGPSAAASSTSGRGMSAKPSLDQPPQQVISKAPSVPSPPRGPSASASIQSYKGPPPTQSATDPTTQQVPKITEPVNAVASKLQQPPTGTQNTESVSTVTSNGKPPVPKRRQRCIPPQLKQYIPVRGGGVCKPESANTAAAKAVAAGAGKCAPPIPPRQSALQNLQITRTSAQGKMGDYIEGILNRASDIIMSTRQQCGGATPPVFRRTGPVPQTCEDLDQQQQLAGDSTGISSLAPGQTDAPTCGQADDPVGPGSVGKYLKEIAPQYQELFATTLSPEDQTTLTLLTTVGTLLDTIEDTGLTRMDPIQLCSDKTLANLVDVGNKMLIGLKEHLAKVSSSPQELPKDPFMAQITREAYDALNIGAESLEVAVGLLKDVTQLCGELVEHPELMEKCAADLDEARRKNEGLMKDIGEKQMEACRTAAKDQAGESTDEKSILDKELGGPEEDNGGEDPDVSAQAEMLRQPDGLPGEDFTTTETDETTPGIDEATGDTVKTQDQGVDPTAAAQVKEAGVEAEGQPAKDFGNRGVEPGEDGVVGSSPNDTSGPKTGLAELAIAPTAPGGKTTASEDSSNASKVRALDDSAPAQQQPRSQANNPTSNQLTSNANSQPGGGRIAFITVSFIVGVAVGYIFSKSFGLFKSAGRGIGGLYWGDSGLSCRPPPLTLPPLPAPPEPQMVLPKPACGSL